MRVWLASPRRMRGVERGDLKAMRTMLNAVRAVLKVQRVAPEVMGAGLGLLRMKMSAMRTLPDMEPTDAECCAGDAQAGIPGICTGFFAALGMTPVWKSSPEPMPRRGLFTRSFAAIRMTRDQKIKRSRDRALTRRGRIAKSRA